MGGEIEGEREEEKVVGGVIGREGGVIGREGRREREREGWRRRV